MVTLSLRSLIAAAVIGSLAATASANDAIQSATQAYAKAWASHDVERIVALHTDDSEFVLFVDGTPRALGKPAIRAAFGAILRDLPNYKATADSVEFGDNFAIVQYRIQMPPGAPFTLGQRRFTPAVKPYDLHAIDVIHFKSGLVSSKHTYIDSESAHNNSAAVERIGKTP